MREQSVRRPGSHLNLRHPPAVVGLVEIWFCPADRDGDGDRQSGDGSEERKHPRGPKAGLRSIPRCVATGAPLTPRETCVHLFSPGRERLDDMLDVVQAKILGAAHNEFLDSYVLSESRYGLLFSIGCAKSPISPCTYLCKPCGFLHGNSRLSLIPVCRFLVLQFVHQRLSYPHQDVRDDKSFGCRSYDHLPGARLWSLRNPGTVFLSPHPFGSSRTTSTTSQLYGRNRMPRTVVHWASSYV